MKVTADLDDELAVTIKKLATVQKKTAGEVLIDLARTALRPKARLVRKNGLLTIGKVKGGVPVTPELVNRLRDELP